MGRTRALEVLLSADDFDAELAERIWMDRSTLPAEYLVQLVRIAHVGSQCLQPRPHRAQGWSRYDLPRADRRVPSHSDFFLECARDRDAARMSVATTRGFQTHDGEMTLAKLVGSLAGR